MLLLLRLPLLYFYINGTYTKIKLLSQSVFHWNILKVNKTQEMSGLTEGQFSY